MNHPPTEKDFIRVFSRVFRLQNKPLLSGSEFDDCAALKLDSFSQNLSAESLTFSTDTVRESTDFPAGMSLWQRGWMTAAVNLSDLAAMGSKPVAFLFSAGLPRGFTLKDAEELAQGIQDCVSFFGGEVIGGDTEFNEELTITGTVIGLSENKTLVFRKNAKQGDLLCVTGFTGSAGVALSVLLGQIREPASEGFLKNLVEPFPRIFEGMMLAKSGAVNSMIDTSDGLASSVYELSALSGVFFEIDESSLPLDDEALSIFSTYLKNDRDAASHRPNNDRVAASHRPNNDRVAASHRPNNDRIVASHRPKNQNEQNENQNMTDEQIEAKARSLLVHEALYTGGDYELLFTIPPDKLSVVEELFEKFNENAAIRFESLSSTGKSGRYPCRFTVIGKAIAEKENVIIRQPGFGGQRLPLLKMGYDSFTKYI